MDTPENSIISSVIEEDKEIAKEYEEGVELMWNRVIKIDSVEKQSKGDLRRVMRNPFLQRILHPKEVPTMEVTYRPMYFLLYPMLLGNYKMQSKVISDYQLKHELHLYEPLLSSK